MAQHWKERLDTKKHRDFMTGSQDAGGIPVEAPADNLITRWVYFIQTTDCTLQFVSVEQIHTARDYFSVRIHAARREWNNGLEHYWQRWFERLPPGVHREPARVRILSALDRLLYDVSSDKVQERLST
jgi:hypothetical protein